MSTPSHDSQFRTCPACGNLTPAAIPHCAHCGASSIETVFADQQAVSERRFLQALFTRSNPFTMIFIGINVGVFVLMWLAGGFAVTSPDPAVLIGFGAKQNALIAGQHQYWRLITSMFIHVGIIHLLLNNYALWIIGQEIERIYGSARFVILYVVTGLIGSLGSYAFNPQATSAGASGAIFGLFGVMATFAFRYRSEIPELLSREIKRRILPIIAINLVFGFSVRIVDNAAHIGGLLAGIVLALIVPYKRPNERRTPIVWRALQLVCLAIVFVSLGEAFVNYDGPRLRISNLATKPGSSVPTYFDRMQDARLGLRTSIESLGAFLRQPSRLENSTSVLSAASDAVERGVSALSAVPRIDPVADQYRERLRSLINEQKDILNRAGRVPETTTLGTTSEHFRSFSGDEEALTDRFKSFERDYREWLPRFLNDHGYELQPGDH